MKEKCQLLGCVRLFAIQALLSKEFSRQEYWSGLHSHLVGGSDQTQVSKIYSEYKKQVASHFKKKKRVTKWEDLIPDIKTS